MLHVYALDPAILTNWNNCRNVLNLMGFRHGRAIAAYPTRKRWRDFVKTACRTSEGVGDLERKRILDKLEQSMSKIVWSKSWSDDSQDGMRLDQWLRNAIAIQDRARCFHAILSNQNPTAHADVIIDEDIDETHERLRLAREEPVLREPQALSQHVRTLVTNSRTLLLVDPHIDPAIGRWRPIIGACLELANQTVRDIPMKVELHTLATDRSASLSVFREAFFRYILPLVPQDLRSVHVYRWRRRLAGPHDFHGRYILTERGGYRLDKGLDEEYGTEQPVSLLDDNELKRLLNGYRKGDEQFFETDDDFALRSTA